MVTSIGLPVFPAHEVFLDHDWGYQFAREKLAHALLNISS
jgi:hypothetical protein